MKPSRSMDVNTPPPPHTHTHIHIYTHTYTYRHTHTYIHTYKHIPTVKFKGATIDCHLNMKLHVEHLERTCVIGRMNVTKLNLTNTTLLICLYKIVVRQNMDYAALATLNKIQRHRLEVIKNRYLRYVKGYLILTVFLTVNVVLVVRL